MALTIDFDAGNSGPNDFRTVPDGRYLVRIAEVRPGTTRAGDERWSLRLVAADGPYADRQVAWDSLVFSTRGRSRARLVFRALGLPHEGKVQVEPADLEGRTAIADVRGATYTDPSGGSVTRNEVPYDGWQPAGAVR